MTTPNSRVDAYLRNEKRWPEEMAALRSLALESGLTEELKWGQPCYTVNGKNVFLIHGFKEYFALLFMKGALMSDPDGLLIRQTENVQSGRQMRFTSAKDFTAKKAKAKKYLKEAIAVEKSGAKIEMKEHAAYEQPEELVALLKKNAALRKAFNALTPGRQRGYILYFAGAKQSKTREARIEKSIPLILEGKGLTD